jgi:hypothetical protein
MPYSKVEITEYSHRIGKSVPTLWRWIREGCNLRDPKSVREWETRNEIQSGKTIFDVNFLQYPE